MTEDPIETHLWICRPVGGVNWSRSRLGVVQRVGQLRSLPRLRTDQRDDMMAVTGQTARTQAVLPAALVVGSAIAEPAIAVVVLAAVTVLAAIVPHVVPVAIVVPVPAENPATATEDAAQNLRPENASADTGGELARPGQEAMAVRLPGGRLVALLVCAGRLLVRRWCWRPVPWIARLAGALRPWRGESSRRTALLLVGPKLGARLLEGVMLRHERLRHVIEEAGRPLLKVLLDPGFGPRISRSGLPCRFVKVLEQLIDGLLVLLVHLMPPSRSVISQ
jgi:hypothetical protein